MKHSLATLTVLLAFALGGCGLLSGETDETRGWSAVKLYSEARSALNDGNYDTAIKYYEKLEARFPYGRYAQQAQIEIAYAYYKDQEATSAVAAAERFIKLHPNHPNVDYMYYLRGLANFNDDLGIMGYLGGAGHDRTRSQGGAGRVRGIQGTCHALSKQQVHTGRR